MKKKMTAFIALVMAVVITASSVSGTYAKYTTSAESADEARVAKWAVNATNTVDLFASSYIVGGTKATGTAGEETIVQSTEKVVAPGTKGEYSFTLSNTGNETNYTLAVEIVDGADKSFDNIKNITYSLDGTEVGDFDALKAALTDLYKDEVYAPTATMQGHKIGWEWKFDQYTTVADTDTVHEDDTTLGTAGTAQVKLTVKVTATQSNLAATVK